MDFVTLHRDPDRHGFFETHSGPGIFFADSIRCWVVASPLDIQAILRLPHTRAGTADAPSAYETLRRDLGRDFPNIVLALRYIPLAWEGEEHARLRRRFAELLRARRTALGDSAPAIVRRLFTAVKDRSKIDLVGDIINPLVGHLLSAIADVQLDDWTMAFGSTAIFDRMIGLRKRREIDERLGAVRSAIRGALGAEASEEEVGLRLALYILGADTLRGTLAESLYQILRANRGRRFADLEYPAIPTESGVPIVERVVEVPFEYGGHVFARGERLRILMQGLGYSPDPADSARIFGIGSHSCLGRHLSLDAWAALTDELSRLPIVPEIKEYALRADDYTFMTPEKLVVGVIR